VLQGISQAAGIDFIDQGADRDRAIVGKKGARALLMDEGGGRDIPVRGEGMGGTELAEDLDEQGNDSLRTRTLSSSRAIIIIIRGAI
jgi:hypothetical protein